MQYRFCNAEMKQLLDELIANFEPKQRRELARRAEDLLSRLDQFETVNRRIAEEQLRGESESSEHQQWGQDEARHDLRLLIEALTDSADIPVEEAGELVYTIEDLAGQFQVSKKTICRWRDQGLVSRRFLFDSRKRVGFLQSSVDRFVAENAEHVERASRFTQLSDAERDEIVEQARRLTEAGHPRADVVSLVADKTGRTAETIRTTLKRHEEQHPDAAPVLQPAGALGEKMRRDIYREHLKGQSVAKLARRFRRPERVISRAVREVRMQRVVELDLDYMPSDEFHEPDAEEKIMAPLPEPEHKVRKRRAPAGLPQYLASLYEVPLLTREQEYHLFRRFNYLKFRAAQLRSSLNPQRPQSRALDQVERYYAEAIEIKNRLTRANLRLVVSVAKKYVDQQDRFFEWVSDGNMSLIRAIEKFDYTMGVKFSTYATWAIKNNLTRKFTTQLRRQSRFHNSQEEMLSALPTHRSDPRELESAQNERESQVQRILQQLDGREREVIIQRFGLRQGTEPQTLKDIGAELGVSKERIRQIEKRAMDKLRHAIKGEKFELVAA